MALLFSPFHTSKPKQFNYRPVYYDAGKERLEKMKKEAESAGRNPSCAGLQRGFLKEQRERSRHKTALDKISTIRFLLILLVLVLLLYLIAPELFTAMLKNQ
ncbi:MAG: hypothetical protein LBR08_13445 [Bacteroidales bacterium]|jgi:hypothetical protein|nr:hypothetical protein [Bacteroidales bacterium]